MKEKGWLFHWKEQLQKWKKWQYVLLVLFLGIVIMLLPSCKKDEVTEMEVVKENETEALQKQLEEILSMIHGAGRVRVLLSLREDSRYTYQSDVDLYTEDNQVEQSEKTVLVRNRDGAESAVVVGIQYPLYQGAVVICDGADSAAVKLNIVNAVADLTGLGSDKISVIKMQGK